MCMYVAHWNIFMVNKRDLQQKQKQNNISNVVNMISVSVCLFIPPKWLYFSSQKTGVHIVFTLSTEITIIVCFHSTSAQIWVCSNFCVGQSVLKTSYFSRIHLPSIFSENFIITDCSRSGLFSSCCHFLIRL